MHFVLELIQNADDNQYHTKAQFNFCHRFKYLLTFITMNQVLKSNNIQALCDIGKSTKGKHQQGYIGQKGIGFKSVFTIW